MINQFRSILGEDLVSPPSRGQQFQIRCHECGEWLIRKHQPKSYRSQIYVCKRCSYRGEGNPFSGKTHSEETKVKIGSHPSVRHFGEDNGFFGKTHSEETKEVIIEKNRLFQESLTEEERTEISRKQREGHRRRHDQDPESYIQGKRNGGKAAAEVSEKYKMNKLERFFFDTITKEGIDIEYSVILDRKQYDFGNKEKRVLIEINGDFWHGNPSIYSALSDRQIAAHEKDRVKKEWAELKGFKVLSFWESDIRNRIDDVLSEVKNAIL